MASQPAGRTNATDYIEPYVSHTDKNPTNHHNSIVD